MGIREMGIKEMGRMSMEEIVEQLDAQLILGMEYTTPNETTKEREQTGYCLRPGSHCHTCIMVSFGKDCRNNPVVDRFSCERCDKTDVAAGVDFRKFASHP